MNKNKLLNYLGFTLLGLILFGAGFYFGFKIQESYTLAQKNDQNSKVLKDSVKALETQEIKALEVPGVFWIKLNKEPICPTTHPIKGTFSTDSGNYYTPDYSRFKTVKPDICFATEEYARDIVGFVKKF